VEPTRRFGEKRLWFEQAEQFFFRRFTQLTVLWLLTTEKIMGTDAKTMSEAWGLWDQIWADSRIAFLPEPDGLEKEFRANLRLPADRPSFGPMLTFWLSLPSWV
jgi:hypothetical protein